MKTPDRITTVAFATVATVLLAAVSFALAAPPARGPGDSALPTIATTVAAGTNANTPVVETAPLVVVTPDEPLVSDDADDEHEVVKPQIRVEDSDDDYGDWDSDDDDGSDKDSDDDEKSSNTRDGGESSEKGKAAQPRH